MTHCAPPQVVLINSQPIQTMSIPFTPVVANIMGPQGLFILFVLLLLFGAKKLPELARGLGQAIREFSKAKNEIADEILRESERRPEQPRQLDVPPATVAGAQTTGTQPAVAQTSPHPHDQPGGHA